MKVIHSVGIIVAAACFGLTTAPAADSTTPKDSALENLRQRVHQEPNNLDVQRRFATILIQRHRESEATNAAIIARNGDPHDLLSKHLLITALARSGNYREALSVWSEDPQEPEAPGEVKGIISAARQAAEIESSLETAIAANDRTVLIQVARRLEAAAFSDPENPALQKTLGWLYLEKLHWPHQAYPHITRAAKMHSDDSEVQKLLALVCSQTGRLHRALAGFQQVLAREPGDAWMQFNEARTLAWLGRREEAEAIYTQILRQAPTNFSARLGQAELTAWRGQLAVAEGEVRKLLNEKPHDPEAELLLADIHRWEWRIKEAKTEYADVLKQSPDFLEAKIGQRELREAGGAILGGNAYHFTDNTHFGRSYAGASLRIPMSDDIYLVGRGVGSRFTNPGFKDIERIDGFGGLEIHAGRAFEISGQFGAFHYDHLNFTYGGEVLAKISPAPEEDFYLSLGVKEPFVSSIVTVSNALRQDYVGGGCNLALGRDFLIEGSIQAARISDGNQWIDAQPELAYHLLRNPDLKMGVEYEYLTYAERRTTYWTPNNRHVISPRADLCVDLWPGVVKIPATVQVPYVFSKSEFGIQVQAGLEIHMTDHLHLTGSYLYSSVPGDDGAWSGTGWQAAFAWIF